MPWLRIHVMAGILRPIYDGLKRFLGISDPESERREFYRRLQSRKELGLPVLKSDLIFYQHMNEPGFVEGVVTFFNEADEKFRRSGNQM
jgi:hypothetical protein